MDAVEVTLPGGISAQGDWHRKAFLHPLAGRDEAFLCEQGRLLFPAQRTTALLTRLLGRLGPIEPVTPEYVSALTVGDREALLLHLRRITVGDNMACVLSCPNRTCGEKLDLDLSVNDLLLPAYPCAEAIHERIVEDEERSYRIRFRLPNGADQETVAALALKDIEAASNLVLKRCAQQVFIEGNENHPLPDLPLSVIREMPQILSRLDPQAEIRLNMQCPVCEIAFDVVFDTANYLFSELAAKRDNLYQEVHLLAFNYHWSEADILSLTRQKRHLYIGLLTEAMKERMAK